MTSTPTGAHRDDDPSQTTQLRVPGHRNWNTGTFRRIKKALPRYDYEHYSRLAGPLTQPDPNKPYTVQYRSLISQEPHRIRIALMLLAAPVLSLVLLVWLLQPSHWTERDYPAFEWLPALDVVMLVSIGLIEFFRCMNVLSNAHATLVARDPVPVVPETGTRVAFLTSFVPGKEPLEMVTKTLEAAVKIRHRGLMHVWLLDEGDDPEVKAVCERLGVHHFSRKGVAKWNQKKGPHRAKTKHGNYNAWLDAHGDHYDYFASVDTDHVPLPNYLERMLGFFRDPDVGFVSRHRRSIRLLRHFAPGRRAQHVRHRREARPGQEGLPGDPGRLRVRPGRREVHQGRPDEGGPLVPDAHHPERREDPQRLRPRRHRPAGPGQERDLRPGDQGVGVHRRGPAVPDLPGAVPDAERQDLLLGVERGLRAGRRRPRPGRLGREDQQVQGGPGAERPRPDGDVQHGAAAARPGREIHGHRRRRGGRVPEVQ
ncbi:hypothetical protein STENM223S_04391 [Streptomyces tendae]